MTKNVSRYEGFIAEIGQILAEYTLQLDTQLDDHKLALEQAALEEEQRRQEEEAEAQRQQEEQKLLAQQSEQQRKEQAEQQAAAQKRKTIMSYAVKIAAALAVLAVLVLLVLFQLRRLRAQREEERLDQEEERRYQAQRRRYDPDAYGAEEPQDYDGGMDGDAGRSARYSRQAYDAPDDGQYEDNDRYEDTYEAPKRRNQRQAGRSRSTERRGRGGGYTPKH